MKKLLTILGTIGLTATTGAAVVACSQNPNQNENKLVDAQTTTVEMQLKETRIGQILTENDQKDVSETIIANLKRANQIAANVNDNTFDFDLSQVTPEFPSLKVQVKSTAPSVDLPGLKSGEIKITLKLTRKNPASIPAQGTHVILKLNETTADKVLTENDQLLLKKKIEDELIKINSGGANVTRTTFKFDISQIKPTHKEIDVQVNSTESNGYLPGLSESTVKVTMSLTPQLQETVNAKSAKVNFDLQDSKPGQELSQNDKELLQIEIINQLKKENQDYVVEDNTFVVDLNGIKPEHKMWTVKVNPTDSTIDKPGLKNTPTSVLLSLNLPKLEKVEAKTTSVEFNLTQTQKENILTSDDQRLLHQEIINQLMATNADAVVSNGTFEFNLTEITPESSSVHVVVKETDSTPDKPGLKSGEIDVDLTLHAAPKDQVQPKDAIVNLELTETHYGDVLTEVDQALLRQEIIKSLTEANQGAIIDENTFEFDVTKIVAGDTSDMTVHVHATESTVDNPGLKEGTARVQLLLIPVWE